MYKVHFVGNEVCCSVGRQRNVARHRNYRQALSLPLCYSQKTKNRLPPEHHRHITFPPAVLRHMLVLPGPPKAVRSYFYTAGDLAACFVVPETAAKKTKSAYRRKLPPYCITAPPVFAQKNVADDYLDKYSS